MEVPQVPPPQEQEQEGPLRELVPLELELELRRGRSHDSARPSTSR